MSNIFAIFLQSLCIKLGSVTGMNLAENCKAHLPPWLNYVLYFFAESAIIATDIAEVIGTAIALNILIKVPLVAGCAISIVDVLIILVPMLVALLLVILLPDLILYIPRLVMPKFV